MKILFTLILLLSYGTLSAQESGWYRQYVDSKNNVGINNIHNRDTGWISSFRYDSLGNPVAMIFKTVNEGSIWSKVIIPQTPTSCGGIAVYDDSNMYGIPYPGNSKLYRTTNAGETWKIEEINMQSSVSDLIKLNQDTFIAHNGVNFTRTVNGGKTWGLNGALIGFHDMHFSDSKHGCVVGEQKLFSPNPHLPSAGGFMRTTNAGQSWEEFYTGIEGELWTVWMVDSQVIIAGSSLGRIGKTIDGGKNWKKIETGSLAVFNDIMFPTKMIGYAVASRGRIIKTIDQGETWSELNSTLRYQVDTSANIYLSSVFFADSLTGWIGGEGGIILHTTDGGKLWVRQHLPKPLTTSVNPEPFARKTSISYELPSAVKVKIHIYDILDKELEVLESPGVQDAGTHTIEFDGSRYPEGTFHYQIETDGFYGRGKMTKVVY